MGVALLKCVEVCAKHGVITRRIAVFKHKAAVGKTNRMSGSVGNVQRLTAIRVVAEDCLFSAKGKRDLPTSGGRLLTALVGCSTSS